MDMKLMGFEEINHTPLIETGKPYKIYAQLLDTYAQQQFLDVLNYAPVTTAALMPDAHSGYTMPIGAVCATHDVIVPQFVGFDIGCGMCVYKTSYSKSDVEQHAQAIYQGITTRIPLGFKTHATAQRVEIDLPRTALAQYIVETIGQFQLGTLGGGNHFIEVGYGNDDAAWIVIHSGSRGLGHKLATHYITQAYAQEHPELNNIDLMLAEFSERHAQFKLHNPTAFETSFEKYKLKQTLELQKRGKGIGADQIKGIYGLDVHSQLGQGYIMDQNFALAFALANRKRMISDIVQVMNDLMGGADEFAHEDENRFINRNHNHAEYDADMGQWIHRKGATHAKEGMSGVIPGNMRDGSFVVKGKGNPESLFSSSHGAGRVMSRTKAQSTVNMVDFKESMKGITGTVDEHTVDESPFAYKDIFEVMDLQKDLVDVVEHIRVLINVKDNTPSFKYRNKGVPDNAERC